MPLVRPVLSVPAWLQDATLFLWGDRRMSWRTLRFRKLSPVVVNHVLRGLVSAAVLLIAVIACFFVERQRRLHQLQERCWWDVKRNAPGLRGLLPPDSWEEKQLLSAVPPAGSDATVFLGGSDVGFLVWGFRWTPGLNASEFPLEWLDRYLPPTSSCKDEHPESSYTRRCMPIDGSVLWQEVKLFYDPDTGWITVLEITVAPDTLSCLEASKRIALFFHRERVERLRHIRR